MQILHGKGSTYFANSDSTLRSIISRSGLQSFVYTNRILTKLCRWKLRGPVIMNHRVNTFVRHESLAESVLCHWTVCLELTVRCTATVKRSPMLSANLFSRLNVDIEVTCYWTCVAAVTYRHVVEDDLARWRPVIVQLHQPSCTVTSHLNHPAVFMATCRTCEKKLIKNVGKKAYMDNAPYVLYIQ